MAPPPLRLTIGIRLLGPGDEDVLDGIADDVFDGPVRRDLLKAFLEDPRHHLAVAIESGRVVGAASAVHYVHPDKEPELWINEIGVAGSHRRRGIARRLVDALLAHGREIGCQEAWVLAEGDNEPALGLYRSLGGTRPAAETVIFSFDLRS